jgi:predicted phosphodiesterase
MQRKIKLIILASLLVGGAIICAIRWKAWFALPQEPMWEGEELKVNFVTFADENVHNKLQKDTLEFLLLGDIHSGIDTAVWNNISIRHKNIDFWAQLGDWMERPYLYYKQMMYHSIKGTEFENLPIINIPGNHEYYKGIIKELDGEWTHIFQHPNNGPKRFLGRSYIVDLPTIRIITIDTDGLQLLSDYTQVAFWVKNALREANDRLTIVMMHHPVFSTADGRQNVFLWLTFYGVLREADVVFSGHDHNYARREVEYKERFWTKQQPTIFIGTNASHKNYPNKQDDNYDCVYSGNPVYEHIKIINDSLHIYTYELETGKLIDEIGLRNNK